MIIKETITATIKSAGISRRNEPLRNNYLASSASATTEVESSAGTSATALSATGSDTSTAGASATAATSVTTSGARSGVDVMPSP